MGAVVNAVRDTGSQTLIPSNQTSYATKSKFNIAEATNSLSTNTSLSFHKGWNTTPIINEFR